MKQEVPFVSICVSVDYPGRTGVLRNAFLQMRRGEMLGLVGQSGSGKSTMALAMLRLLDLKGGKVLGTAYLQGRDLMKLSEREMRKVRGKEIGLVLQSPLSALNPAMKIGSQLAEAWRAHSTGSAAECGQAIRNALKDVTLPSDDDFLRRYPSQLSVGQAQRVLIAQAILHSPVLLIADEPTSALDVITQAEILRLFRMLNLDRGMAILYISHDLTSVASLCDRVAVLHNREIVECAATREILQHPKHPYSKRLIAAQPLLGCLMEPTKEIISVEAGTQSAGQHRLKQLDHSNSGRIR
jgi:ABC-type dipeptide/oligopeptide/nickel transport system ATPase component